MIDAVIFDLDGTLWDTCTACAVAWNKVLARHQIHFREITSDDVRRVTGKPHETCIRETFLGLPEDDLKILIDETMTEDNLSVELLGGELYEGVNSGLHQLAMKYPLFIVSNCQSGYIETFLKLTGFDSLFRDFECWGDTGNPKPQNLAAVIERNSLKKAVMVGDMESDLLAARDCGVPFFYMEHGFGHVSSFEQTFASFPALTKFLINQ